MILDWTNWTFWVTTLAMVAFGFCLRVLYERWYFRKVRNKVRDEVCDLTQRLEAATERLNKANADTVSKSPLAVEAERIAVNIAKLPDLVRRKGDSR